MGRQEGKSCVGGNTGGVGERLEMRVCSVDMEARRQDYNQARSEAKRAFFKAKNDEIRRGFARTWRGLYDLI